MSHLSLFSVTKKVTRLFLHFSNKSLRVVSGQNRKTWNPEPRTCCCYCLIINSTQTVQVFKFRFVPSRTQKNDVTVWRNRHICTKFQENHHIFGSAQKNFFFETCQCPIESGMWCFVTKMWRHICRVFACAFVRLQMCVCVNRSVWASMSLYVCVCMYAYVWVCANILVYPICLHCWCHSSRIFVTCGVMR